MLKVDFIGKGEEKPAAHLLVSGPRAGKDY
jgi:hypothetical protein